ncbi:DUF2752 domain-containing protein [Cellulomonas fengjieae]|uniref:DUF2752 domain-containing protein n=1 Tax=Cellulomonas fengjieae TaxID=2819978 RepID=A0ABS3SK08_9CELL|nr:DUF2752 domain-containing protein [Cellulomonas fengjieae]MBO3085829.1 DUF2752 domain-containing protein [Cellulomonas fengjieae]MBO3102939.1 DUF2752 domain-containing protein [Cellulomonas fengjieae]QVI67469.1 DUF2752 domain-containing protein [Cellulomonas fengjieae]
MGTVHDGPQVLPTGPLPPDAPASGGAGRRASLTAPLVAGGVVVLSTILLAVRDPHVSGSYGACPLYLVTGLWCPACGGLRATHELAHGDLAGAWAMNPLWVLAVPVVVGLWVRWVGRASRGGRAAPAPTWAAWALLVAVVGFGVLRNVPALAPALAP